MAAQVALGKVTTNAGTPKQVTSNQADPAARLPFHSLMIQALPGNTGKVFIGPKGMDKVSNYFAVLPVPTANAIPSFTVTIAYAPGGLNAANYYIDVDTNGEGATGTALKG